MNVIQQQIVKAANNNQPRIFHSQPLPLNYSTIAVAKRLVDASQMQMALIDAAASAK